MLLSMWCWYHLCKQMCWQRSSTPCGVGSRRLDENHIVDIAQQEPLTVVVVDLEPPS